MLPVGLLMKEHRLIERMVKLMDVELRKAGERGSVDPGFIDTAVDFLRTYADKCHHGKEVKKVKCDDCHINVKRLMNIPILKLMGL